ncbi:MAG: polyphenol oxidase family protein [Acidimicrobiia bacterium]|nr:polyphenol oxidase family protein [Acidimicrobiia bacterium]MDX2467913.1 polyphenol oxidase family protein [Acidimicrobiia bacterium]
MIQPPGFAGVAFGDADSGDLRVDHRRREAIAADLGISSDWAFAHQVHGTGILEASRSGNLGDGDAIVTYDPTIPAAIATADCVPIVIEADGAVAVVHAGWRGAVDGIIPAALAKLRSSGHKPRRAAIGPAIGPCCYEVGSDVADLFPGYVAKTTWGSVSVDISAFLERQLAELEVWRSSQCTFTTPDLHSWRRDHTRQRQVTVAWLLND